MGLTGPHGYSGLSQLCGPSRRGGNL